MISPLDGLEASFQWKGVHWLCFSRGCTQRDVSKPEHEAVDEEADGRDPLLRDDWRTAQDEPIKRCSVSRNATLAMLAHEMEHSNAADPGVYMLDFACHR